MSQQIHFGHYSVLLGETIDMLNINPDGIYLDCTLGGGGHSEAILKKITENNGKGKLVCIDRDDYALEKASERLRAYGDSKILCKGNYADAKNILLSLGIDKIDGATADLGVSSFQLDDTSRGFSYMNDAPLDMRMNRDDSLDAYDVVNTYSESELCRIIRDYGEENFYKKIASNIVKARQIKPVETTFELSDIIKNSMPAKVAKTGHHPAKRTFQAIRIEVNGELGIIQNSISDIFSVLKSGGRIAIITFHSLEDRLVKHSFVSLTQGCTCPKDFPVCVCGNKPKAEILTKKPILPSDSELEENPRSRSAKLRGIQKL